MRVYLMRHGTAVDHFEWTGDDSTRPLTPRGVAGAARVIAEMQRRGAAPDVIIASPAARTEQTARIAAEAFDLPVVLVDRVAYGFSARTLPSVLDEADAAGASEVLIVGHQPTVGDVLEEVTGQRVHYKKGACAAVDLTTIDPASGTMAWFVTHATAAE
ncbi:MAG: hypothetical protein FDZ70_05960 [Actinobacteria bacterium]|nr:MAG: hypothetical protein FDZ70_05960 [Actinomycetota bacterium]